MGYRPEDQSLEHSIKVILKGLDEGLIPLFSAITKRVESGEWKESHIQELIDVHLKLVDIKIKLNKLGQDNW